MERISKVPKKGKPGGHKTAPKGYPEKSKMYADPKNFKYPLDTEKHVRAALSYLSKPENQKDYTQSELKTMFSRIYKRCEDFGIDVKKKNNKKAHTELLKRIASVSEYFDNQGLTEYASALHDVLLKVAESDPFFGDKEMFGDQEIVLPAGPPAPSKTEEQKLEEARESEEQANKDLERFEKFKEAVKYAGHRISFSEGLFKVYDGSNVIAVGDGIEEIMDNYRPIFQSIKELKVHNDKLKPYDMKIEAKEEDGNKMYILYNTSYIAPGTSVPRKEPQAYGDSVGDLVRSLYARNPIFGEKVLNILKD